MNDPSRKLPVPPQKVAPVDPVEQSDPRLAESVPVTTAGGVTLVGWAVRADTVVVSAGNLTGDVIVTVNGKDVVAEATFESVVGEAGWHPVTALQLPAGTLNVAGEKFPPDILAQQNTADDSGRHTFNAKIAFWCLIFPRMRGC